MAFSEELRELAARVSNWGRWGDDDELGCGNLLTAEATRRGAAAIHDGRRISLAVDLRLDGIQVGQPAGRLNPILTFTSMNERDKMAPGIWAGTDDLVMMSTCAGTHVDALSHVSYDGRLYGDRPVSSISAATGATWCGAEKLPDIATRGVLLDIPRALGVERLDVGPFGQRRRPRRRARRRQPGRSNRAMRSVSEPARSSGTRRASGTATPSGVDWQTTGLGVSAVEWFWSRDVAAVFCDNYTYEVMPPETGNWDDLLAVHLLQIRDMGMIQGQNWDFEELADAAAEDGRHDFLLVAAPEPIVGATSAPVAPVAIR